MSSCTTCGNLTSSKEETFCAACASLPVVTVPMPIIGQQCTTAKPDDPHVQHLCKEPLQSSPDCEICKITFHKVKQRHQCKRCGAAVCETCSPSKLLIPMGDHALEGVKKDYEPTKPHRVCLHCAPELELLQEELQFCYTPANIENSHQPRRGPHFPFACSMEKACNNAADIVTSFFRDDLGDNVERRIPPALLQHAHGIAFMSQLQSGFLLAAKMGTGIVISKLPDGSWSAPSAIRVCGINGGYQIGTKIVDVMIILGSPQAVNMFTHPQIRFGGALSITAGPYGRSKEACVAVGKGGLKGNYSYAISRGLFVGAALEGAIVVTRKLMNRKFYRKNIEASTLLSGEILRPLAAKPLYDALERAMQGAQAA